MAIELLSGIHGTPSRPVVIDWRGRVLDGRGVEPPLIVTGCKHVEIIGFDACRSSRNVVLVTESEDITIREACAWDASPNTNNMPWRVTNSRHIRLIDCAGWGTGRKTFTFSQGGNDCQCIRCYGRWEMSECDGPKLTFGIAYNNVRSIFTQCIGEAVNVPSDNSFYGAFAADRMDTGEVANTLVHECLAVVPQGTRSFVPHKVTGIRFIECVDSCTATQSVLARLLSSWGGSPMLGRIRAGAGADALEMIRELKPA